MEREAPACGQRRGAATCRVGRAQTGERTRTREMAERAYAKIETEGRVSRGAGTIVWDCIGTVSCGSFGEPHRPRWASWRRGHDGLAEGPPMARRRRLRDHITGNSELAEGQPGDGCRREERSSELAEGRGTKESKEKQGNRTRRTRHAEGREASISSTLPGRDKVRTMPWQRGEICL